MKKRIITFLLSLSVLLAAVFGFATLSHAMNINGTLQGEQVIWEIRTGQGIGFMSGSYFGFDQGLDWICDLGLNNIRQTNADIGFTTGLFNDENNDGSLDLLVVRANNVYNSYYNSVSMKVYNSSNVSIIMPQPTLNWMGQAAVPVQDGTAITLCNQEGTPVVEFRWNNNTGRTLIPGGRFEEVFEFSVLSKADPPTSKLNGLTPGYWKNWRNHYSEEQFKILLQGTIAMDIASADAIFSKFCAAPGKELTIFKAQLLATQLTLNLTKMMEMPNPDGAFLTENGQVEWKGVMISIGSATKRALDILANPAAFTREQILDTTLLLDMINNT